MDEQKLNESRIQIATFILNKRKELGISQAALITNDVETILLMPLMLNK